MVEGRGQMMIWVSQPLGEGVATEKELSDLVSLVFRERILSRVLINATPNAESQNQIVTLPKLMYFNSLLQREREQIAEYYDNWKKFQVHFRHRYFRSSEIVFHRDPTPQPSTSITQSFPACPGIEGNNTKTRAGLFKHDSCLDNQQ